jgi:preprotein translocase subunit SecE
LVLVGLLIKLFFKIACGKFAANFAVNRTLRLDKFLLTVSVLPIAAAIGGFYYFDDQPQWIRVIALLAAVGVSVLIALQTAIGQTAWAFRRDAIIEVRKVVWPTRKETVQTTMIVLVVVIIMSLLLWALDSLLAWAVRVLTG